MPRPSRRCTLHTYTAQSHSKPHAHHYAGRSTAVAAPAASAAKPKPKPKLCNPRHPERTLRTQPQPSTLRPGWSWVELVPLCQLAKSINEKPVRSHPAVPAVVVEQLQNTPLTQIGSQVTLPIGLSELATCHFSIIFWAVLCRAAVADVRLTAKRTHGPTK